MGALLAWIDEPDQASFSFRDAVAGSLSGRAASPANAIAEIELRSLAPLRERRFTAWRGRSGKRYVASVFAALDEAALGFADAVLIAVSAERQIVAVRDSGPFGVEAAMARWRSAVVAAGAVEIHVHLLADTSEARRAAIADLTVVMSS